MTGPLAKWNTLFIDLVAEPYRLLTFTYRASEPIGLIMPTILFILGVVFCAYEAKQGLRTTMHHSLKMKRL